MIPITNTREWQVEALLASASVATPLSTELGQAFVSIPLQTEAHQVIPLHSKAFRNWLLERFHTEHQVNPRANALRDVTNLLEAKTQFGNGPRTPIARRIARTETGVLLDLYNDQGQAVEIDTAGWRITQNLGAPFRSTRSSRPLPQPAPSPRSPLNDLLHLTPKHFTHVITWLNAAMQPTGPYPILVLQGPESPARTATAHILRSIIDPGPTPFCPPPRTVRDVHSLATHNWILAIDQIERLPFKVLRELTDLATGSVIAARDCPSDPEPFHVYLQRPLRFTTSESIAFGEKALIIEVPGGAITTQGFEQLHPQILGALCTAAGKPAPHWQPAAKAPHPVRTALLKFLSPQTKWTGTATELLQSLRASNPNQNWPETPKGLTQLLNKTPLGNLDFQSLKDAQGRRTIELTLVIEEQITIAKDAPMRRTEIKQKPKTEAARDAPSAISVHSRPFAAKSSLAILGFP